MKKRQLSTCWVMDSNTFQRSVRKAGDLEGGVLQMLQGLINLFIRHESWYETMAYDGCFWLSVMRFHFAQLTDPNSPASTCTLAETHTNDHQPTYHSYSFQDFTHTDTEWHRHIQSHYALKWDSNAFNCIFHHFLCPIGIDFDIFDSHAYTLGFNDLKCPLIHLDTIYTEDYSGSDSKLSGRRSTNTLASS
jgi:hypothetical protein